MNIRKLKQEYRNEGIDWIIIERTEQKALAKKKTGKAYEVFVIETNEPHPIFSPNSEYDLVEVMPKNEQWGKKGWSFATKEAAMECYMALESLLEVRSKKRQSKKIKGEG